MRSVFLVICLLYSLTETSAWRRRRRRRSPPPCSAVNCQVGSWTSWSSCSHQCGTSGTQTRTRQLVRAASCGGTCPYYFRETQACNRDKCRNGGKPYSGGCSCRTGYSGTCCDQVHGGWSSWSGWTSCSQSCGSGSQERSRTCTSPPPRYGGRSCAGAARQTQTCNKQACPVDGGWSGWGVWSSCSEPCDIGTQGRSRSCTNPPPRNGGKSCPGAANEQRVCNTHSCPVHGGWSSWSVSKPCSVTCGSGVEILSRTCTNPAPKHGGRSCHGDAQKQQACTRKPCPIDGGWSSWSGWTSCTKSCATGSQQRSRSCTRPRPRYGGKSCPGSKLERQACNKQPCPVHGGWSSWSAWSSCSKPCGTGFQQRSRSCTSPAPSYGGKPCEGAARESKDCNAHSCPVDGGWSGWSVSTPCSVTCGSGVEILSRTCTDPAPKHGGRSCPGAGRKEQACRKNPCPINGGWSSWSVSKPCSVTCGSGVEILSRTCTNPAPEHGGKSCPGDAQKKQACTKNPCPIDGGWSSWSDWNSCSKSCGTGVQERSRSCTRPAPSYGGKPCDGVARESRWCNTHSCPVDGGWSVWGSWSPCGKTCGGGVRERTRSCTNPPPFHGGKGCGAHYYESKECAVNKCPVHGGWSKWSNWTECSVTCGAGVMSRERYCDNPVPVYGGRPCEGTHRDRKSCVTGEVCMAGIGCYENFPSVLLGSFTDEIDWFAHFASQMEKIIKKCAHLAVKKRHRFFAVEGYGNCYGAQSSPSGGEMKATRCNFGVGLENYYYVYEVSS